MFMRYINNMSEISESATYNERTKSLWKSRKNGRKKPNILL